MDTIDFFVDGTPVGKQRPKFNSKQHRTYTPRKTADWEKHIQNVYKLLELPKIPAGIPVTVNVTAYFVPPKSWAKYKRIAYAQDEAFHIVKPDCDNVLKCVLDALNGLAYDDDRQVFAANVSKYYSEREGLRIALTPQDGEC